MHGMSQPVCAILQPNWCDANRVHSPCQIGNAGRAIEKHAFEIRRLVTGCKSFAAGRCTSDAAHFAWCTILSRAETVHRLLLIESGSREKPRKEASKGQRRRTCLEIVPRRWLDHWRTMLHAYCDPTRFLANRFRRRTAYWYTAWAIHLFTANANMVQRINSCLSLHWNCHRWNRKRISNVPRGDIFINSTIVEKIEMQIAKTIILLLFVFVCAINISIATHIV